MFPSDMVITACASQKVFCEDTELDPGPLLVLAMPSAATEGGNEDEATPSSLYVYSAVHKDKISFDISTPISPTPLPAVAVKQKTTLDAVTATPPPPLAKR